MVLRPWAEALYGLDEKLLKKIVNSSGRILEIEQVKIVKSLLYFKKQAL